MGLTVITVQVVGTLYTHHQKLVIVDAQGPGNSRRLIAFIGGIDLCQGRYDTPQHTLFRDLNTVFKDDFHNPTFPVSEIIDWQPFSEQIGANTVITRE